MPPRRSPAQIYAHMVAYVATLPQTKVTITWGEPHFRVGEKIFSGWGLIMERNERRLGSGVAGHDGVWRMGAKLHPDKQAALIASDPRFVIAPYVGKYGWVSFAPGPTPNWGEIEALLLESYYNIAPKKLVKELMSKPGQPGKPGKPAR